MFWPNEYPEWNGLWMICGNCLLGDFMAHGHDFHGERERQTDRLYLSHDFYLYDFNNKYNNY